MKTQNKFSVFNKDTEDAFGNPPYGKFKEKPIYFPTRLPH